MNRVMEPQPSQGINVSLSRRAVIAATTALVLTGCVVGERPEQPEPGVEASAPDLEESRYVESFLEDPTVHTEARTFVGMSAAVIEQRCAEEGVNCPVFMPIQNREDAYAPSNSEYMKVIGYESDEGLSVKVHVFSRDEASANAGQISGISMLKYTDEDLVSSAAYMHIGDDSLVYGYRYNSTTDEPLKGYMAAIGTSINYEDGYRADELGFFDDNNEIVMDSRDPKPTTDQWAQDVFGTVQDIIAPNL